MDTVVFTPAGLLGILAEIEELHEYEIGISEGLDGNYLLQIGNSIYELPTDEIESVAVTEDVVDKVEDVNEEAYQELESTEGIDVDTVPIESGLLKEAVKAMLLGGAIKLSAKLLK